MTVPILVCVCGHRNDVHDAAPANGTPPDSVPTPGESLGICTGCARVYLLNDANAWEPFDVDTLDAAQRSEVLRVQRAVREVRRMAGRTRSDPS